MADPEATPSAEWLNLTQAAHRLGWPRERLRSLARRGRLQTKRGNTSELFVLLTPELVDLAQAEPKAGPGPTVAVADPDHLRDRVAELEDQVADLRVDLARAEERVKTADAIAHAKEAASRDLLAELRRDLEWHRQPWWQRWFSPLVRNQEK